MSVPIDAAIHACREIAREIKDRQKNLTVHYVVHDEGQRTEALAIAAQNIMYHPAAETMLRILQKPVKSEHSALIGTAVASQNVLWGLARRDSYLTLCTLNLARHQNLKEAQREAWHLAWHALDAIRFEENKKSDLSQENRIRSRKTMEMARANLCADVFSVLMAHAHRDRKAVSQSALNRALATLNTRHDYHPEFYPYVMALDATEYALGQREIATVTKKKMLDKVLQTTREITRTIDDRDIRHWIAFAETAQEMAWRGYKNADILGAAIHSSPDTFIRAIGYQVSELTEIQPSAITKIDEKYNPFAKDSENEDLHHRVMDLIFEDIVAKGLDQKNGLPFQNLANQQNSDLTSGTITGWCAAALQAAGQAFETAWKEGGEPASSARQIFENKKHVVSWRDLKELGKRAIGVRRQGDVVALEDLQDLVGDIEGLKSLRQSVQKTLDSARPQNGPAPAGPAPVLSAKPAGPAPVPLPIPTLGGAAKPTAIPETETETERTKETASDKAAD